MTQNIPSFSTCRATGVICELANGQRVMYIDDCHDIKIKHAPPKEGDFIKLQFACNRYKVGEIYEIVEDFPLSQLVQVKKENYVPYTVAYRNLIYATDEEITNRKTK